MICFVVSSSTTRFPLLLSQHVEECCGWFPMLSEYSSILSSMIQLWTCLLHRGCDEIWEDDTSKWIYIYFYVCVEYFHCLY